MEVAITASESKGERPTPAAGPLTFSTTTDSQGYRYWVDFEYWPSYAGLSRYVYRGRLNGKGPRAGEHCAVKVFINRQSELCDWDSYISTAITASELASSFNSTLATDQKIKFSLPVVAEIESTSTFSFWAAFCCQRKKLKEEYVAIEPFLQGKFQLFPVGTPVDAANNSHLVQAYSHYTYWFTEGQLLVTDLQGVITNRGKKFQLTNPVIYSVVNDLENKKVKKFFDKHQCSSICQDWNLNCNYDRVLESSHGFSSMDMNSLNEVS